MKNKDVIIIGYDHYVKLFFIITILGIIVLILFLNLPESNLFDHIFFSYIIPILMIMTIFAAGVSLITERKKILIQISRNYEKSCNIIEKYLIDNKYKYLIKKRNIPYVYTRTIINLSLSSFKIIILKGVGDIGIQMNPIKTIKKDGKYLEDIIIEMIKKS